MASYPIKGFRLRLAETTEWCAYRVHTDDPKHSLRSIALRPPENALSWPAKVEWVCLRRAELIQRGLQEEARLSAWNQSRLLLFDPGQTLSDGAAEVESNGFFDGDDTPPWDTWITYVEESRQRVDRWTYLDSYLLSWVPAPFVDIVERSIAVNPEECIRWASDVDTPFIRELRATGVVGL